VQTFLDLFKSEHLEDDDDQEAMMTKLKKNNEKLFSRSSPLK
jgi:hypothetical protein